MLRPRQFYELVLGVVLQFWTALTKKLNMIAKPYRCLLFRGLDNADRQANSIVRFVFIALDKLDQEGSSRIHERSDFGRYVFLQITQPIIEEPNTYSIWVLRVVRLAFQSEITDVSTSPLFDAGRQSPKETPAIFVISG